MSSGGFRARPSRKAGSFAGRVAREMLAKERLQSKNDKLSYALAKSEQGVKELKDEVSQLEADYNHADFDAGWKAALGSTLLEAINADLGREQGLRNAYARLRGELLNADGSLNAEAQDQWSPLFAELEGGAVTMAALEADFQGAVPLAPDLVAAPPTGLGLATVPPPAATVATMSVAAWQPDKDSMQEPFDDAECRWFAHTAQCMTPIAPSLTEDELSSEYDLVKKFMEGLSRRHPGESLAALFGMYANVGAVVCYNERLRRVANEQERDADKRWASNGGGLDVRRLLEDHRKSHSG